MTDITRLITSLKRRSAHAKEFGHDVLFVKLEDLDALGEALEKAQQRPEPYAYLRENDGQIQISIGAERPSDRSGGYATPWFAIYTAAVAE
ncbi:TPA: hypothetical protein OMU40_003979 [Klebsiella aerogenes]|nr:hypothetical protein [Klebsiella aerogenes]